MCALLMVVGWVTTAAASVDDLFAAAAAGDAAKIERLLRPGGGYPPNSVDRMGRTPLLIAIFEGHEQAVRALVDGGANVNYATADGDTPLMAAAFRGNQGIVRYLLQKGADPSRVNRDGQTARDVAGLKGYAAIVDLLSPSSPRSATAPSPSIASPSPRTDQQLDEKPLEPRPSLFPGVPSLIYTNSAFAAVPRPKVQEWKEVVELRDAGKVDRSTARYAVVDADQRLIRVNYEGSSGDRQWSVKALGGMMLLAWGRRAAEPICSVDSIQSVSGQLFPLKEGNRLSVRGSWRCPKGVSPLEKSWRVLAQVEAYPTLGGHMWMVVDSDGITFHFIDALGIALYRGGQEGGMHVTQRLVEFTPVVGQAFNCRVCKLPSAAQ